MKRKSTIYRTLVASTCFSAMIPFHSSAQNNALDEYHHANALYIKNLFELAIEEYKDFLQKYPNSEKYNYAKAGLAFAYYEIEDYANAQPLLEQLTSDRTAPYQEQTHIFLGNCLLIAGEPAKAEAAFRWSVNRGKEKFFVELPGANDQVSESGALSIGTLEDKEALEIGMAGLIEALYQQGKWDQVISTSEELIKQIPDGKYSVRARFLSALAHYTRQHYVEAAEIGEHIISIATKDSPYIEDIHYLVADSFFKIKKYDGAVRYFEKVGRSFKGRFASDSLYKLGLIRFDQKNFRQAIIDFSELIQNYNASEQSPFAGIYLGRCYLSEKRYNQARSTFKSLESNTLVNAEATHWLAKTYIEEKNYIYAISTLKGALKFFPSSTLVPNYLFDLGNCYLEEKNYQDASSYFARLVNEFPKHRLAPDALRLNTFSLNRNSNYRESLEQAEKFLLLFPGTPFAEDVTFIHVENLYYLERYDDSLSEYQQFVPFNGKGKYTDQARMRMMQCAASLKKWQKVLDEYEALSTSTDLKDRFFNQRAYLAGLSSYKLRKWDSAIKQFESYLQQFPTEDSVDSAYMKCALCYSKIEKPILAIDLLKQLLQKFPNSTFRAHALTELGTQLYLQKKYKDARTALEAVRHKFSSSPFAAYSEYYLAWLSIDENKSQEAVVHFANVYEQFPKHELAAESLFQQALQLMKLSAYSQAESKFRSYIENYRNGKDLESSGFYFAVCISRQKRYEEARGTFTRFIEKFPSSSFKERALYESAWCSRNMKQPAEALAYYKKLEVDFPSGVLRNSAIFEMSEVHFENKQFNKAVSYLDTLLAKQISRDLTEKVWYRMGWCLIGRDQQVQALEYFEKLLLNYPESSYTPEASYQAGELRLNLKNYEQAYLHFSKAANYDPTNVVREQALIRVGEAENLTERWDKAEATFNDFIRTYPNSDFIRRAYLLLGWSQENLAKYRYALQNYAVVLESSTRDELAARSQFQTGECLYALKEYNDAIKALVKVETSYNYPLWTRRSILEVGQVLDQMGDKQRANENFRRVTAEYPGTDEASLALEILRERNAL